LQTFYVFKKFLFLTFLFCILTQKYTKKGNKKLLRVCLLVSEGRKKVDFVIALINKVLGVKYKD